MSQQLWHSTFIHLVECWVYSGKTSLKLFLFHNVAIPHFIIEIKSSNKVIKLKIYQTISLKTKYMFCCIFNIKSLAHNISFVWKISWKQLQIISKYFWTVKGVTYHFGLYTPQDVMIQILQKDKSIMENTELVRERVHLNTDD